MRPINGDLYSVSLKMLFAYAMTKPEIPKIPAMITLTAACLIIVAVVFINISAQTPDATAIVAAQSLFGWIITTAGTIALLVGIIYGFFKKQRYDNLETERNEWKSLAESREERYTELALRKSELESRLTLKIERKETTITNLKVSNDAVVRMNLQMKAILKGLRLAGKWEGHEDNIHDTSQPNEERE
jgi:hypothetical protein